MSADEAQKVVKEADVVWLSGGEGIRKIDA